MTVTQRYFPTAHRETGGYPTSDGKPMAETDLHRKVMFQAIDTLMDWYKTRPDVYVTGNLLLFYEQGNKRRHVAPDCFVAFGVPNHDRLHYKLWEERVTPAVVIEITSRTTRAEDTKKKFELYQSVIRVPEYFLFDPKREYLDPPLIGYRLADGGYVPIEPVGDRLPSESLGLHLEREGEYLRFWHPPTGRWIPTAAERTASERERAEAERERAEATESELARLRAELARLQRNGK